MVGAVAAFYTTPMTTTLVGLALGKIFISRLAHYRILDRKLSTAGKKHYNCCEEGATARPGHIMLQIIIAMQHCSLNPIMLRV